MTETRTYGVLLLELATLVVCVALAGCSQTSPAAQDPLVSRPGHDPATAHAHASDTVRVRVLQQGTSTAASRALVSFVRARAESLNSGAVSGALRRVATPDQVQRQRGVIAFAREHGFAVPTRPRIAVVAAEAAGPGAGADAMLLSVCLWLPSTEYVDAESGEPVNGPVPQRWAPVAVTTLHRQMTWSVDKLVPPDSEDSISCGGLA